MCWLVFYFNSIVRFVCTEFDGHVCEEVRGHRHIGAVRRVGFAFSQFNSQQAKKSTVVQFALTFCLSLASIAAHHLFEDTKDMGLFRKLMEVNFYGYLYCTRSAFEPLLKSRGVLVAVTSFSGEVTLSFLVLCEISHAVNTSKVGLPYRSAYCASKFAVTGFLEALRSEMAVVEKKTLAQTWA